ncbi:hypothetical protein BDM02DRAFT_3127578 [Thelephora ganbajun]|uniref:Uncharacterized protein n=1 Tax=Thelephora ganbajun TaxID=370292 RepID=A0ACB6ZMF8_THEGA|nr:hypothetical protein BDM02DRAFT_3127578 [Thelephora ganbajun]
MSALIRAEMHTKPDLPGFKSLSGSSRPPKPADTQLFLYKSRSTFSSPSRRQRNSPSTLSLPPSPKATVPANRETPSTPYKVRKYSPLTPSASVSSFGTGSFAFPTPRTPPKSRSRSEKMLRETLRRAEEYDRTKGSPFFLPTPLKEDDDSDCDCEDLDGFFGHRVGSSRSRLTRNNSIDQKRSVSPTPQQGSSRRASTASSSNEDVLTPHGAVLKRRLEGVLSQARDQDRRKSHRSVSRPRAYTRESSEDWNSQSTSPLLVYSPGLPPQSLGPLTPPPTPPHVPSVLSRTTSHPTNTGRPLPTPSSPSFDARTASAMCRRINGYVSFANVEGLGSPPEDDSESTEAGRHHAWLKWLGLKQTAGVEGVARA